MKLYLSIPALAAAGILSACSSSSPSVDQFGDALAMFEALENEDYSMVAVDDESLPDSATMNGYIAASADDGETAYIGDATAEFDFVSNEISGSATNFNEYALTEPDEEGGMPTGERTRALDGDLEITGNLADDGFGNQGFGYEAYGELSSDVEDYGTVTSDVYLSGEGEVVANGDGELAAYGDHDGWADLNSSTEGYLGEAYLEGFLVLQE